MKKRIFTVAMVLVMLSAFVPAFTVSANVTATPSAHTVLVNGNSVALRAFNIDGHNFFMLRDVAFVLMDTTSRFDVFWDSTRGAINLTTGVTYNPAGGGLSEGGSVAVIAVQSTAVVYVNDSLVNLRAYNINGHNYFMLRDLGTALGFEVDWDASAGAVLIRTDADGTTPQPSPTPAPAQTPISAPAPSPTPTSAPAVTPRPSTSDTFNVITAAEWVSGVRIGWNLGNQFDARTSRGQSVRQMETAWVNTPVSRQTINAVSNAGFNAIRIPVTWQKAVDDNFTIRTDWLARIREVVDYAVANDMYIMLNTHHDDEIFRLMNSDLAESQRAIEAIWRQIATEFRDYNERLVFQGLNEPRTRGSEAEWRGGTEEERNNLNILNQLFVDTVRATGGNNAERVLIVPTYSASPTQAAQSALVVPRDSVTNRIIVSIHFYEPYNFALNTGNGAVSNWSRTNPSDTNPITERIDRAHRIFVSQGIPVVISEMGAMNRGNDAAREAWTEFYLSHAHSRGIPCFWWDNGNHAAQGSGERFGIFDRSSAQLVAPEIVAAMLRATE